MGDKNKLGGKYQDIGTIKVGDETTINNNYYANPAATLPKELTLNLPKTHPGDIIGRENDLDELHRLLGTEKRVLLVNGLGGIGKTTLAQAYVYQYYEQYRHIAWIAQDSDNLANDIVNTQGLRENLSIPAEFDPQQLFGEVIRKLKGIADKPNLLVVDNAEQSIKLCLNVLPSQPDWHLLVTSREEVSGLFTKELDFLSLEQAVELFKKHYTHKKLDEGQIRELVTAVDRHTLTVEILAKTAQALRYDTGQLQNAIANDLQANLDVAHNKQHAGLNRITAYLGAVFNLSNLNEGEIALMKQFACLPAEFHSYELLKDLLVNEDGPGATAFTESLNSLAQKGWLLQNKETDSYKMHRIIAEVTKKQQNISVADVKVPLDAITGRLYLDETRDNPVDKFTWIPFGKALLANFDNVADGEMAVLQNNLALVLRELGDYRGAKALLEKALASDEKNFGTDHLKTANRYSNLALVLKNLGDYQGAKELLEKALTFAEKNFGADHPTTASYYSNLATVLKDLGDYRGAKALLEKANASAEKNFGAEHPTTAISYSNLATVLQDLGDYQGAKALLEKAVASDEKNFGTEHPTTAIDYSNLAAVLRALGDYQEAKGLLEKALASAEKIFGEEHPKTAIRSSNLATVLQDLGDYQGAKALLEKALASNEKNFGTEHPETAISYSNLALVLKDLGDYQGVKVLLEKALASDEMNFGVEHPTTAISYHNLSAMLYELRDYNEALRLSDAALAIVRKVFPAGHPTIETVRWWNEEIKSKIK